MMRERASLLILLVVLFAASVLSYSPARAIPAFARKYGVRCTTCHESWPVLNDFGRAFRDNGYQMRLGKDDPTTTPQGYWPVAIRTTPHYEYNKVTNQPVDDGAGGTVLKTLGTGGIADGAMDLLTAGTLAPNVSFLVVPTGFASDGAVSLESYFVYLTRVFFKSDWFNLRIGRHEVDLPVSAHRSINLTNGYLIYGYHSGTPDLAPMDMGTNQRGIEITGHDHGSFTRYNLSVFTANDGPIGSANALDSPSFYGHLQKYWQMNSGAVSEFEVGAFGNQSNYPTTQLTSGGTPIPGTGGTLKASTRYGGEAQVWIGPAVAPLHLELVGAGGSDAKQLYSGGADQDGKWTGGFLEAIWVPAQDMLHMGLFGRYDMIRNSQQPIATDPKSLNDQDQITAGIKYTFNYNNRAEYALHAEYQTNTAKKVGFDPVSLNPVDVQSSTVFIGIDFAF